MKMALFITGDKVGEDDIGFLSVLILDIKGSCIASVKKDVLKGKSINYLSLWLLTQQIKEVYVMDIAPAVKKMFENIGVVVRSHDDLQKNPLLKSLLT